MLSEDDIEISVRTVERVLAEEGFPKLPRRTRIRLGTTVKGAEIPERSEIVSMADLDGMRFNSASAGVYLFAPFLGTDQIYEIILYTYEALAHFGTVN